MATANFTFTMRHHTIREKVVAGFCFGMVSGDAAGDRELLLVAAMAEFDPDHHSWDDLGEVVRRCFNGIINNVEPDFLPDIVDWAFGGMTDRPLPIQCRTANPMFACGMRGVAQIISPDGVAAGQGEDFIAEWAQRFAANRAVSDITDSILTDGYQEAAREMGEGVDWGAVAQMLMATMSVLEDARL